MIRKLNSIFTIALLTACIAAGMSLLCCFDVHAEDIAVSIDGIDVPIVSTPEEFAEEVGNVSGENEDEVTSLMVMAGFGELDDSYGASAISYSECTEMYILEFKTQTETMKAYETLVAQFGEDKVMLDLPVKATATEFNYKYQTYSSKTPANSVSWGADFMNLDAVRDVANGNTTKYTHKVTVAILDSGYNPDSRLTKGRISKASRSYLGSSYVDDYEHGSHVAGIVADCTSEQVDLMILKVLNNKGAGSLSTVFDAAVYARDNGADILNMSFAVDMSAFKNGMDSMLKTYSTYDKFLKSVKDSGAFIICASGNEYHNADDNYVFPAISKNTLAVGAIDLSKRRASFSNYGKCIDYAAPGVGIASSTLSGDKLIERQGTSMATPHVSAAYAMAEVLNLSSNPELIQNYIDSCTVDIGATGKDINFGNGYICMSKPLVTLKSDTAIYDPEQKEFDEQPAVASVAMTSGSAITEGIDYTVEVLPVTGPGRNYVRITFTGDYSGYGTVDAPYNVTYKVTPKVSLSRYSYSYNGTERRPSIMVKYGDTTLKENVDYTITKPTKSIRPGTYKVAVTLKGSYKGSGTAAYTIRKGAITPEIHMNQTRFLYTGNKKNLINSFNITDEVGAVMKPSEYIITYHKTPSGPATEAREIGTYYLRITWKNYTSTKNICRAFTVAPKRTSIKSFGKSSRSFTVAWRKQPVKTDGYQIRYSTKSSMKDSRQITIRRSSSTSKKVSGLKNRCRYYVQIRTYSKVNGKYYYSAWSTRKSVQTK